MKDDQYFPLEANVMNDERLAAVVEKFGAKGIGIYLVLLIELRKQPGYRCGLNSVRLLARTYKLGTNVLESVIHDFGLFDVTDSQGTPMISSLYLDRVMKKYEQNKARCSQGGRKRATLARRDACGKFTSSPGAYNIYTAAATIEVNTSLDNASGNKHWKEYVTQAMNDGEWMQLQAKHSGLGGSLLKYSGHVADLFIQHVITHGKDHTLFSVSEVKYYLANFTRRGTPTNKRLARELYKLEQAEQQDDPYRYETIDPATGARSYYGNPIPPDAPPRPSERVTWNYERHLWE